jgi:hypothetical protein
MLPGPVRGEASDRFIEICCPPVIMLVRPGKISRLGYRLPRREGMRKHGRRSCRIIRCLLFSVASVTILAKRGVTVQ